MMRFTVGKQRNTFMIYMINFQLALFSVTVTAVEISIAVATNSELAVDASSQLAVDASSQLEASIRNQLAVDISNQLQAQADASNQLEIKLDLEKDITHDMVTFLNSPQEFNYEQRQVEAYRFHFDMKVYLYGGEKNWDPDDDMYMPIYGEAFEFIDICMDIVALGLFDVYNFPQAKGAEQM